MKKQILIIAAAAVTTLLTSCDQNSKKVNTETEKTQESTARAHDIVKRSFTDKSGKKLDLIFDNSKDIVTINFEGETAELEIQKSASGFWYKNANYELSGKGNDIQLMKDGKVIFENLEEKVDIVAKNDKGDVLNMTFNNTAGTVKAYLNGGEQIDLTKQKSASGIWYRNDHYELNGKGDNYELLKDGKTIFKN